MANPLLFKSKVLLVKIETSYGVDPTPTQAVLATDVTCRPMEGEDVDRGIERPYFGAQEMFPAGTRVVLEFDVELVGSGSAGVAPAWGPLLRSCACAETINAGTSVVYTRVSAAHESAAVYFWIGGNRQKILGERGNVELRVTAQQIPKLHFTLTGLYAEPTLVTTPAIDLSAFKAPLVSNSVNTPVFTVDSVALEMRSFTFNLGNDVQPRFLVNRNEVLIVDSNEQITASVGAVALATLNPFAKATPGATGLPKVAVALTHDTRIGHKTALTCATCQVQRPDGYTNDQNILMWPLKLKPLPTDAGNDQFAITLT